MAPEIPVFLPHIGVDTIKAAADAFDVGWLGMGAATKEFEERIAAYLGGGRHVVATNTGTSALHLGLIIAGVGPGDEVITPSFNFVADHQAITAVGADPVFCDVREDDLGIDPEQAALLSGPRTKAIMPLHYAGIPCHLADVYQLAESRSLRVIEDATHAFGTRYGGRRIGSFGDLICFSFDPVKVITSVDGGAVVVDSERDVERLHHLRLLGIDKDTVERYRNQRAWEYDVVCQGFRYHLTNINASIGISQLKRVDEFILSRQRACRLYNELLAEVPGVEVPRTDFQNVSPFIYYIRVKDGRRAELIEHLGANGIATGIHFLPAHRYTFFKSCRQGSMTVTDRVTEEILTLPLHSNMRAAMVERIVGQIRRFFRAERSRLALVVTPALPTAEDAEVLVTWRMDPQSQQMFYRADFSQADYERTYFEPDTPPPVWIRDRENRRIAMLRFRRYSQFWPPLPESFDEACAFDISVILAPEARGKGLAHTCIQLASEHALRSGAGLLVAEIKPENVPSRRAFERAGYVLLDEVEKRIPELPDPFRVARLIYPG